MIAGIAWLISVYNRSYFAHTLSEDVVFQDEIMTLYELQIRWAGDNDGEAGIFQTAFVAQINFFTFIKIIV